MTTASKIASALRYLASLCVHAGLYFACFVFFYVTGFVTYTRLAHPISVDDAATISTLAAFGAASALYFFLVNVIEALRKHKD